MGRAAVEHRYIRVVDAARERLEYDLEPGRYPGVDVRGPAYQHQDRARVREADGLKCLGELTGMVDLDRASGLPVVKPDGPRASHWQD